MPSLLKQNNSELPLPKPEIWKKSSPNGDMSGGGFLAWGPSASSPGLPLCCWRNPQLGVELTVHGKAFSRTTLLTIVISRASESGDPDTVASSAGVDDGNRRDKDMAQARATQDAWRRPGGTDGGAGAHGATRSVHSVGTTTAPQLDQNINGQALNQPMIPNTNPPPNNGEHALNQQTNPVRTQNPLSCPVLILSFSAFPTLDLFVSALPT
ncbi:hypothetical protein BDP27DRAFT_1438881 [Rhodocollybia butyracea]|uniref:Uncharacterized protein n=1 Tax=Rhodocollybia butyracea TaxID=206335 RepID=A0A9P5P4F0_9AGAR|nr:hypothetical protein BDP27DRAFT_1438881 [Rhodocollybia butyracea]